VLLAHLRHFKSDFLVFKFNALGGAVLFFNSDLFFAAGVETQEAHRENNGILHVTLHLKPDWVANQALLLCVCNLNTTIKT
jgi:hypothetical protein